MGHPCSGWGNAVGASTEDTKEVGECRAGRVQLHVRCLCLSLQDLHRGLVAAIFRSSNVPISSDASCSKFSKCVWDRQEGKHFSSKSASRRSCDRKKKQKMARGGVLSS